MQRKLPLHAFARDDPAHGEHLAAARPAAGDDHAVEDLDAFLLSFEDARVNVDGVADGECVWLGLEARGFDMGKDLLAHGMLLWGWLIGWVRWRVAVTACSCRHSAIRRWSPESKTSGTCKPRNSRGRVY